MRVRKLKNGKAADRDEIIGEMIKGGCNRMKYWIWSLCNMVFESSIVPEDWRSSGVISLYKGKRKNAECKDYRGWKNILGDIGRLSP